MYFAQYADRVRNMRTELTARRDESRWHSEETLRELLLSAATDERKDGASLTLLRSYPTIRNYIFVLKRTASMPVKMLAVQLASETNLPRRYPRAMLSAIVEHVPDPDVVEEAATMLLQRDPPKDDLWIILGRSIGCSLEAARLLAQEEDLTVPELIRLFKRVPYEKQALQCDIALRIAKRGSATDALAAADAVPDFAGDIWKAFFRKPRGREELVFLVKRRAAGAWERSYEMLLASTNPYDHLHLMRTVPEREQEAFRRFVECLTCYHDRYCQDLQWGLKMMPELRASVGHRILKYPNDRGLRFVAQHIPERQDDALNMLVDAAKNDGPSRLALLQWCTAKIPEKALLVARRILDNEATDTELRLIMREVPDLRREAIHAYMACERRTYLQRRRCLDEFPNFADDFLGQDEW